MRNQVGRNEENQGSESGKGAPRKQLRGGIGKKRKGRNRKPSSQNRNGKADERKQEGKGKARRRKQKGST